MDIVRRSLLVLTLTFPPAIAPAVAQIDAAHPVLTGTWNLDLGKSRVPKQWKGLAETITISCSGLSIAMRFTAAGKESDSTYITDGRTRIVDQDPRPRMEIKAYWKKSALVIQENPQPAIIPVPGAGTVDGIPKTIFIPFRTTERWTLSADGRTLRREIESGHSPQFILVYDKQP